VTFERRSSLCEEQSLSRVHHRCEICQKRIMVDEIIIALGCASIYCIHPLETDHQHTSNCIVEAARFRNFVRVHRSFKTIVHSLLFVITPPRERSRHPCPLHPTPPSTAGRQFGRDVSGASLPPSFRKFLCTVPAL
jgi:hypothetical protein